MVGGCSEQLSESMELRPASQYIFPRQIGMRVFKYVLHISFATIVPMTLAVAAVFICPLVTDLLHIGIPASTYQRLGSTPPFLIQIVAALILGLLLSTRIGERKCALWVWFIPAVWMLVGIATWKPTGSVFDASIWQWFFSANWWALPASPFRSRCVTDQFTHTVPLFTSVAYAFGAFLRMPHAAKSGSIRMVAR